MPLSLARRQGPFRVSVGLFCAIRCQPKPPDAIHRIGTIAPMMGRFAQRCSRDARIISRINTARFAQTIHRFVHKRPRSGALTSFSVLPLYNHWGCGQEIPRRKFRRSGLLEGTVHPRLRQRNGGHNTTCRTRFGVGLVKVFSAIYLVAENFRVPHGRFRIMLGPLYARERKLNRKKYII